jgi:hypothetical protein
MVTAYPMAIRASGPSLLIIEKQHVTMRGGPGGGTFFKKTDPVQFLAACWCSAVPVAFLSSSSRNFARSRTQNPHVRRLSAHMASLKPQNLKPQEQEICSARPAPAARGLRADVTAAQSHTRHTSTSIQHTTQSTRQRRGQSTPPPGAPVTCARAPHAPPRSPPCPCAETPPVATMRCILRRPAPRGCGAVDGGVQSTLGSNAEAVHASTCSTQSAATPVRSDVRRMH